MDETGVFAMTERIERLYDILRIPKIKLNVEKATLFTEAYQQYDSDPDIIRLAKSQAYILDNINIFMLDGDLIAGSPAFQTMAIETDFWVKGTCQPEEIESLCSEDYSITDEQSHKMKELTEYWHKIFPVYKLNDLYDEPMRAYKSSLYFLPVNRILKEAAGIGYAGYSSDILPEADTCQIDYGCMIGKGLKAVIEETKAELKIISNESIRKVKDMERIYLLRAIIIIYEAVIRWAERYAKLAEDKAGACTDEKRKNELLTIAEACHHVPAYPARTFQEALQFQWFIFLITACQATTPLGRIDQYLYPYYCKDIDEGRIDDEQVLEFLQCYRLKFMQMKNTSDRQSRLKWPGQARWNNATIGGVKADGSDAANELSYLILEAAIRCKTPRHTISLRVHEGTPEKLMQKAIELLKTGIGMPFFESDR